MTTIEAYRSIRQPVDTQSLAILEKALTDALKQNEIDEALYIYIFLFGGYRHLAWRLGDYNRGLRLTTLLVEVGGIELQGHLSTRPWLEQSLFYLDTGHLHLAETNLKELFDVYKQQVARRVEMSNRLHQIKDEADKSIIDEFIEEYAQSMRWLRGGEDDFWIMYESNLLQSVCDSLIAQGKLIEAESVAETIVKKFESQDWPELNESGSNPFGRRAIARFNLGKSEQALADFEKSIVITHPRTHEQILSEGLHLARYCFSLLRLGRLQRAGQILGRCQWKKAKLSRPLLATWYELAFAEYYLTTQKDDLATSYAQSALTWADRSGHQETFIRAHLLLARLGMRYHYGENVQYHLQAVENTVRSGNYRILLVDAFVLQSHAALLKKQLERAKVYAEEAYQVSTKQCGYRWGQGNAAHLLSDLAYQHNDLTTAKHWAEEAIRLRKLMLDPKIKNSETLLARIENNEMS